MTNKLWLIALVATAGCGTPASDTSGPTATSEAPAYEDGAATTTLVNFNPDGAPVAEFEAPGMHCSMCAAKIVQVMKEKPGVLDVKADAETKIVSVAYADDQFESDFAIEAVAEAGFGEATPVDTPMPVEELIEEAPAKDATVEG